MNVSRKPAIARDTNESRVGQRTERRASDRSKGREEWFGRGEAKGKRSQDVSTCMKTASGRGVDVMGNRQALGNRGSLSRDHTLSDACIWRLLRWVQELGVPATTLRAVGTGAPKIVEREEEQWREEVGRPALKRGRDFTGRRASRAHPISDASVTCGDNTSQGRLERP